tara:strand:- start:257 stop:394 length:138 start_codon:yes stop_codon:yes gene_type:complete
VIALFGYVLLRNEEKDALPEPRREQQKERYGKRDRDTQSRWMKRE